MDNVYQLLQIKIPRSRHQIPPLSFHFLVPQTKPKKPHFPSPQMLAFLLFFSLAAASSSSSSLASPDGTTRLWCVAKNNAEDATLQTALDWACGPGGADCGPIQQGGDCYDSGDVQKMASYAFNDYYLRHGVTDDACYFDNNAALTSLDPSDGKCKLKSSVVVNNASLSSSSPTAVGVGPSADLNGCSEMARGWFFLPIVFGHMLFVIARCIQGLYF